MEKVQTPYTAFYDEWFSTQKKIVDNWVEATETFQKTLVGSTNNEPQQGQPSAAATQFLQNWMDMQLGVIQNFKKMLHGTNGLNGMNGTNGNGSEAHNAAMPSMPQIKEFTELQLSMMQNFVEFAKRFVSSTPNQWAKGFNGFNFQTPDKTTNIDIFKQMFDFQQQMMNNYAEYMRNFQNMSGMAKNSYGMASDVFGLYDKWTEMYNQMLGYMNRTFNDMMSGAQSEVVRDTIQNVMNSSATYVKLFEFLTPLYKAIQERTLSPENYQFMLDPARYKEVMDKVFEFAAPQTMQEYFDTMGKMITAANTIGQRNMKNMTEAFEKNMALLPQMAGGDPTVMVRMYEHVMGAYRQNTNPFFKLPQEGKWYEVSLILKHIGELSGNYANHVTQMQYLTYKTGQAAMETLVAKAMELVKTGEELKGFNDFFRMWVDINERTFIDTFNSEEFSKLQAEMVEVGMRIRQDYETLMEKMLEDLPVVPRSEMDRVCKRLHDLDNKVHELEKELESTRIAKVQATPAKKAATKAE